MLEYKRLKIDESAKSINPRDLPNDFCDEACRIVDEFHRKTFNEKVEWMLYFDYATGEIIYCWKSENSNVEVDLDRTYLKHKRIASIHSHTKNLYSFPSPENFDILENEFEDYEIVTSVDVFWTIEFKGNVDNVSRKDFQQKIGEYMYSKMLSIGLENNPCDINIVTEKIIGNYLLKEIDKDIQGINLILNKKEYD